MANLGKIIYLSEAQKNELFTNNSVTSNGTTITYSDNDLYVTPDANVEDVKINLTSIVSNNVANIPLASDSAFGVIKIANGLGTGIVDGKVAVVKADASRIKVGADQYRSIVPEQLHVSTFYGLTKAAGVDMSSSSNEVGTYTNAAKDAIQNMLGVSDLISTRESPTATAAHAANSLFLMDGKLHKATNAIEIGSSIVAGTNCLVVKADEVFVKNTDKATSSTPGLVRFAASANYGIWYKNAPENDVLRIACAGENEIKAGTSSYMPIVPIQQHKSIYYGLSKLAGVDLANETVTVGTYPTASKAAIQSMLGIDPASIAALVDIPLVETVTGTTPSITGQPNVRYVCGEVSTLSLTPPASGSIDVIFESGSTATTLTVPNTVKWPTWFDATSLEADTTYEILITDGIYGSVMTWVT